MTTPLRPSKGTMAEVGGGLVLLGILGFFLKAQVLVWGSNVLADSFIDFSGLSMRQGMLLVVFHTIFAAKASVELGQ